MAKSEGKLNSNDHMVGHMYIIDNYNNKINKSYKSQDSLKNENLKSDSFDNLETKLEISTKDSKTKNTTIQDMLKELKAEFPDIPVFLNKSLAKNLVAAFKLKFKNSLTKWHEFLKLVKTSAYLMSIKFHLTIQWLLRFSTIDRLFQGDLGVKLKEVFFSRTPDEEAEIITKEKVKTSGLLKEIDNSEETENCKEVRKKLLQKLGNTRYETWFRKKTFLTEENDGIFIDIPTNNSKFVFDYITNHFRDILESFALTCRETRSFSYVCEAIY